MTIDPQTVTEGNTGKATKTFTATLSQKSGRTVTVNWNTANDTATAGKDYGYKSGTLVFPAGTLTKTFTVDILGDTVNEGDEAFDIVLTRPVGDTSASVLNSPLSVVITDDDAIPTVTFDNMTVKEGDAGNALLLPIKLSNPSSHDIVFGLDDTVTPGTADNGPIDAPGSGDYKLLNTTVTIPKGETTGYAVVLVNGDAVFEGDETAYITAEVDTVSHSDDYIDSSGSPKTAKLTLTNDDKAPVLALDNVTGNEGETVTVTGSVTGVAQDPTDIAVSFAGGSVNGSKAADASDFVNPGPRPFVLEPWMSSGSSFPITQLVLTDDTVNEPAETIVVTGTSLGAATVTNGSVTIAASDGAAPPAAGAPTIVAPVQVTGSVPVSITGVAAAGATVELWGRPDGRHQSSAGQAADHDGQRHQRCVQLLAPDQHRLPVPDHGRHADVGREDGLGHAGPAVHRQLAVVRHGQPRCSGQPARRGPDGDHPALGQRRLGQHHLAWHDR